MRNIHIWEAEIREFEHFKKKDSNQLVDYQNSWRLIIKLTTNWLID